ncbi:MAG: hypothetical protein ACEQSX_12275 [Baekduiaceae bacterium]
MLTHQDPPPDPWCACCFGGGFVAAGDEHVPCPACNPLAHGLEAERRRATGAPALTRRRGRVYATRLDERAPVR